MSSKMLTVCNRGFCVMSANFQVFLSAKEVLRIFAAIFSKCSQANNSVGALSPWPWRKFESTWIAKDTLRGDWIRRGLFRGEKNKQDVVAVL